MAVDKNKEHEDKADTVEEPETEDEDETETAQEPEAVEDEAETIKEEAEETSPQSVVDSPARTPSDEVSLHSAEHVTCTEREGEGDNIIINYSYLRFL